MVIFISYNNEIRDSEVKDLMLNAIELENNSYTIILRRLDDTSKTIIASQPIQDALSDQDWMHNNNASRSLREIMNFQSDVSSAYLFSTGGQKFFFEKKNTKSFTYSDILSSSFYDELVRKKGGYIVLQNIGGILDSDDLEYVSFIRMVRSLETFQPIGILCLNIEFERIFNKNNDTINIFEMEDALCVVKHTDSNYVNEEMIREAFSHGESFSEIFSDSKGEFAMAGIKNHNLGMNFVKCVPLQELSVPFASTTMVTAIIIVNAVIIIIGAFLVSSYIAKLEKQKILKNAEQEILVAQIKPHFLYNTLDSINSLAITGKTSKVSKTIEALGDFYRLNLNSGNGIVTLEHELASVQSYLYIQNMRYDEIFAVEFDVQDEALQMKVPKMILQPLVENAIYHGVRGVTSEGLIQIKAFVEDGMLHISVFDNGKGIEPERLNRVIKGESGIGIGNTMKRIAIIYDGKSSFDIQSEPGAGTTVEIVIRGRAK